MNKYNFSKLLVVGSLFVATLFYACNKTTSETENVATSITSASPIEFIFEGESKKFLLKTNDSWSATTDCEWITLSESAGRGSVNIILTASENPDNEVRRGKVTIVCGDFSQSIDVVQAAVAPYIVVDESDRLFYPQAGRFTIHVRSNLSFTIEHKGDWLKVVESKALSDETITFSYDENSLNEDRLDTIRIKDSEGKLERAIAIKQLYSNDGKVLQLHAGTVKSPVNLIVIGDGFTVEDNINGGFFEKSVQKVVDHLFSVQPLGAYKDYFNIYMVYANSVDRGADDFPCNEIPENDIKNTIFNCTFNWGGTERLLVVQDREKANEYIYRAAPKGSDHLRLVLVNDQRYGGSGGYFATISLDQYSSEVAIHELGHLFTLADEYVDEDYAKLYNITAKDAKNKPNVDITNDLSLIKWKHFVNRPGYREGAFEGGNYVAEGVWRPWSSSIMCDNRVGFNAISRETIVKKIMEWTGETYSFDEFLRRDVPPTTSPAAFSLERKRPMPVPLEVYVKKEDMPAERNKRFKR